jgi:hypothetical protein
MGVVELDKDNVFDAVVELAAFLAVRPLALAVIGRLAWAVVEVGSFRPAALAGWPKETVSDAAAAKQTIPLMSAIPPKSAIAVERARGRAAPGNLRDDYYR